METSGVYIWAAENSRSGTYPSTMVSNWVVETLSQAAYKGTGDRGSLDKDSIAAHFFRIGVASFFVFFEFARPVCYETWYAL